MPTTALTSEPSTVTVTGTATATAVPDIVRLTIGVSVTQTAVSDAFDAVARLSTALTETLHARGVRGADLTTAGLSVHPQTHWSDGGRQETTGFTASTTFRVVLRELEPEAANSPASVIAACVSVGGDAIRLDGLEFDLDDRSDLATKARELAWTAAESKARQFADLADKDLVEVLEVLEDFDQIVPMRGRVAAMKADSAPIAVERGEIEESISVRVRWAMA
ncbi:SIMPL domain-containing protein [Rhodococcus sp. ARC_M13]|uniref:SIMPL domain-containing protein n=1 Tax=unclassified Rhodococcus (in: high G+C Gram-positive bacteria) TaxID=192944 RepID=UPI001FB1E3B6|nr:SIMPL domain-containing protein [Rhodococcus sp. ARC_M13]MCJ0896291.1 SIMPL domain-containing protein [Rhodococcus sp. ARC_M13]